MQRYQKLETELNNELRRLKKAGLGLTLTEVKVIPKTSSEASGMVANNVVFVFETDKNKALRTLTHEVIDFEITTKTIKPLVDLINVFVAQQSRKVYEDKEQLVENLLKILSHEGNRQ